MLMAKPPLSFAWGACRGQFDNTKTVHLSTFCILHAVTCTAHCEGYWKPVVPQTAQASTETAELKLVRGDVSVELLPTIGSRRHGHLSLSIIWGRYRVLSELHLREPTNK